MHGTAVGQTRSASGLITGPDGAARVAAFVDLLLTVRRDRDNLTLPLIQGVSVLAAGARTVVAGAPEGGERGPELHAHSDLSVTFDSVAG